MGTRRVAVKMERSAPLRLPLHPESPSTESWRSWALRQDLPRAVDLFSGCGGLSLGLEEAGYRVVLAVDSDPWALESHRYNFAGPALDLDLSDPTRVDSLVRLLGDVPIDLIAGGPPCQPFSRAGRSKIRSLVESGVREADDHRKHLWRAYLSVVTAVRPKAALMENVPDMALGDDLSVLRYMTSELEAEGYEVHFALLDAWRYGVPQHRQRLILVALRDGGSFVWPKETDRVRLRDAIGDLPSLRGGVGRAEMRARKPRTAFQLRAREGMQDLGNVVWDHVTRPVREDDREAFELMNAGTKYTDLPKKLRRYRDDIFTDKYNRLDWNDLSRSITAHIAKDGYWYIHPAEARTLTVREAARVQTFPDRFRFSGTRSHAFRQIGNAVPPRLAQVIASEILNASSSEPVPARQRHSRQLKAIRGRLLKWARKNASAQPWRYPGDLWAVVVGAVLSQKSREPTGIIAATLGEMPEPRRVTPARLRAVSASFGERLEKQLARLEKAARVLGRRRLDVEDSAWLGLAGLTSHEASVVRAIGLREDTILTTTQSLRVAARVTGTEVDRKNRLSDGKMILGRIVASGGDAPALNAALHAVGTDICTAADPGCESCPLGDICASS